MTCPGPEWECEPRYQWHRPLHPAAGEHPCQQRVHQPRRDPGHRAPAARGPGHRPGHRHGGDQAEHAQHRAAAAAARGPQVRMKASIS